jgi:hypothetical protein
MSGVDSHANTSLAVLVFVPATGAAIEAVIDVEEEEAPVAAAAAAAMAAEKRAGGVTVK